MKIGHVGFSSDWCQLSWSAPSGLPILEQRPWEEWSVCWISTERERVKLLKLFKATCTDLCLQRYELFFDSGAGTGGSIITSIYALLSSFCRTVPCARLGFLRAKRKHSEGWNCADPQGGHAEHRFHLSLPGQTPPGNFGKLAWQVELTLAVQIRARNANGSCLKSRV